MGLYVQYEGNLSEHEYRFIRDVCTSISKSRRCHPYPSGLMEALQTETHKESQAYIYQPQLEVWDRAVNIAVLAARIALEGDTDLDPIRVAARSNHKRY